MKISNDANVATLGETFFGCASRYNDLVMLTLGTGVGGGFSAQGKYLTDKISAYCERYNYGYFGTPVPGILTATLGNDAGIIGAAALVYS